jgi:lipoprotein-releasing system permease protein
MNFPFYIARRYLFSKKSTHAINLISAISVIGVAVGTMALVVTLSVFNGFHDMVASFFTSFDPQLKVIPVKGKTAPADDPILNEIRNFPQVKVATDVVEDQAYILFHEQQAIVHIKGVDDNYNQLTNIDAILYPENHEPVNLHVANLDYGIPGIGLAQSMGFGAYWPEYLQVYAPIREGQPDLSDPESSFVRDSLRSPGVVFAVKQAKYDRDHMLTSIGFARRLFQQQGMVSSLELRLKDGSDLKDTKKAMRQIAGDKYEVLDRYEQQAETFRIMNIEKFIAYIFLSFILVVACFNIIGSLSMLIIDKKEDVATLRNLGASNKQISGIFMLEGRMITVAGAVIGVILGLLLCYLQQKFGLVKLGESDGMFVVNAYPVSVHFWDIVIVFFTVIAVGWLAVWYPVRYLSKRLLGS